MEQWSKGCSREFGVGRAGKLLLLWGLIAQCNVTRFHSKTVNHLKRGKAKQCERCVGCFSAFCCGLCAFFPNIPVSIWCSVMERLIVRTRAVKSALMNGVPFQPGGVERGHRCKIKVLGKIFAKRSNLMVVCCFEHLDPLLWREDRLEKELWGAQGPANMEPRVGVWPGGK